jgi:uncharacterized protein YndB with AHSA1/START domain
MSTHKKTIKLNQTIQAPVRLVYQAFTNSSMLREWMSDFATLEARAGGRIYLWWNTGYYTSGEFLQLEPEKEITFTWCGRGESRPTIVTVTFKPKRNSTLIKLVHRGLGSGDAWAKASVEFETEWQSCLENLASVLGSGPDLRITNRPMLGINLNDFSPEIANKMGVPVSEGIRLDGVIEGMGAQAAGLQKDDVLVEFAGHPLVDFSSLGSALSGKKAGDTVPVTFYRCQEKNSISLTLSRRSIPQIPPSLIALSDEIGRVYTDVEKKVDVITNNISEMEAGFKPAPEEWSVKEVLAHLIHTERGWQQGIVEIAGGQEASYDGFGSNLEARNLATLIAFPTLVELIQEWKRLNTETIALLASLPAELTQRKGSFWRLAYQCLNFPIHTLAHMEQMKTTLAAARK